MKSLFKILCICLLSFTSFAGERPGVLHRVSDAVDSGVVTVKNTVAKVDTGSLFKSVYGDLKNGIVAFAEVLKVGVEHVYIMLVKQQVVKSITALLIAIVLCVAIYILFKVATSRYKSARLYGGRGLEATPYIVNLIIPAFY